MQIGWVAMFFSIRASASCERPLFASPTTLRCEITTGTPTSRPMRKVSSSESTTRSASLRMWVQYTPPNSFSGWQTSITSSVGAAMAGS